MWLRGWLGHRLPGGFYAGASLPLRLRRGRGYQRDFHYGKNPRVVWTRTPVGVVRAAPRMGFWGFMGILCIVGLIAEFWLFFLGLAVSLVLVRTGYVMFAGWRRRRTQV